MKIEYATEADYEYILERDRHVHQPLVKTKMSEKEIFILWDEGARVVMDEARVLLGQHSLQENLVNKLQGEMIVDVKQERSDCQ
ncbi:hypothetical protein [Paenibacillus sp. Z3-2]